MCNRMTRVGSRALLCAVLHLTLTACGGSDDGSDPFASEGAYIQNVSTTAATIAVLTETEQAFAVELFEDTGDDGDAAQALRSEPVQTVAEEAAKTIHQLDLVDLEPDKSYSYIVRDGAGRIVGEGKLSTAPPPGTRAISFGVLGDSGRTDGRGRQGDVVKRIVEHADHDLVIHTGDLVYPEGERKDYREAFFVPFAPLIENTPFYPSIGNHDVRADDAAPLLEAFHLPTNDADGSERFYSFDYGSVHFVCLDTSTSDLSPGGEQASWLDRDLAAATAPWKVVFFHKSPFSEALHGDDGEVQKAFVPIFESYGVDIVFTGHDHNYQRFKPKGGVHYVVTGGGGTKLRRVSRSDGLAAAEVAYHFVHVTVDATTLRLEAVDVGGTILDEMELVR